ncbi:MAG: KUP/HAK/KT family potassium transporter [Microthrixaceae bacterium]
MSSPTTEQAGLGVLTLGALGVVYGDIGTSPLYSFRETFHGGHLPVTDTNVIGALSLVLWALIIIVSVKYLLYVLRADNKGEGGILALTSLVSPQRSQVIPNSLKWLVLIGLFGTALLYGDGVITPAISVLSAVEGLKVVEPGLKSFVVPIAVGILVGALHGPEARHRRRRQGVRPDHDRLVPHARRARRVQHGQGSLGVGGVQPAARR